MCAPLKIKCITLPLGSWGTDLCCVIAIFTVACLVRTVYWYFDPVISRDGIYYLEIASQGTVEAFRSVGSPPLYEKLLSLLYFGNKAEMEFRGRLINMVIGSLLPVVGYLAARRVLAFRRYALFVATLLIFYADLVQVSSQILRDPLALFFGYSAIAACIFGIRNAKWYFFALGGIFSALCFLVRYEGAMCLLVGLFEIVYLMWCGYHPKRILILDFALFLITFIVVSLTGFYVCGWNMLTLCHKLYMFFAL